MCRKTSVPFLVYVLESMVIIPSLHHQKLTHKCVDEQSFIKKDRVTDVSWPGQSLWNWLQQCGHDNTVYCCYSRVARSECSYGNHVFTSCPLISLDPKPPPTADTPAAEVAAVFTSPSLHGQSGRAFLNDHHPNKLWMLLSDRPRMYSCTTEPGHSWYPQ